MQYISTKWKLATAYFPISIKKVALFALLAVGITLWGKIAIIIFLGCYIFLPLLKIALQIFISIGILVLFSYLVLSLL